MAEFMELRTDIRQSTIVSARAVEPTSPDGTLVARAMAGERDAFGAIYQRYHAGIYQFARAMTGSSVLAEDITQEVFLELIRTLARYDPARAALSTYLYAIARNVSRHRLRRERRFVGFDARLGRELESAEDPSRALTQSETVTRVRAFIRGLSSRYREVLILCDLQGLTYEAAAAILDRPVGTVRSRLHRARHQLAQRLRHADARHSTAHQRARTCPI
jgi:RNA polymerase sigma-70 factor (ECF subfamily)